LPAPSVPPATAPADVRQRFLTLIRGEQRGLRAALQRLGLRLASVPYGALVSLRNLLYQRGWLTRHRAAVPVVSVGNLTVGGTGKTPCVEYVARFYRGRDVRVAILSRGYGSEGGRNDEARLLEENLPDVPHLQGPDRVALAQTAVEELESELVILDDGFQHRRLARDLDLVLIDATAPWGHGYLLPRGLLREPPDSLRRAGVVLITRCDQVAPAALRAIIERVNRIAPGVPVARTRHAPVELVNSLGEVAPLALLRERPVAAFCGIGNPEAFRRTLQDQGATVRDFRTYPDHHAYTRDDIEALRAWSREQPAGTAVVTTQKDLVKVRLALLGECPLWAARVRLHVEDGLEALQGKLNAVITPPRQVPRGVP
jgi:tetraacyldisaccharide 4'-kinase